MPGKGKPKGPKDGFSTVFLAPTRKFKNGEPFFDSDSIDEPEMEREALEDSSQVVQQKDTTEAFALNMESQSNDYDLDAYNSGGTRWPPKGYQ